MSAGDDPQRLELNRLTPVIYDELRQAAEHYLRRQGPGFTLRPTELVHEACLHLMKHAKGDWTSDAHFRAIATQKIWQVLVDHLKRKYAQKRGGAAPPRKGEPSTSGAASNPAWQRVSLERLAVQWHEQEVDVLDLADAMVDLEKESRRLHDVVMLHWFAGLTHAEVAQELGVSASTCEKDFRYALAWLKRRLRETTDRGD